ncbi:hypothetical protein [Caballeronia sp. DA-9]|uniref:hypothetical protein n=1 Tax=Caballeronia sp. DA-9 TaxID=3436237 RepID=UPI003F6612F9
MKHALLLVAVFAATPSPTAFADGDHDYPSWELDRSSYQAQIKSETVQQGAVVEKAPARRASDDADQDMRNPTRSVPATSALIHRAGP